MHMGSQNSTFDLAVLDTTSHCIPTFIDASSGAFPHTSTPASHPPPAPVNDPPVLVNLNFTTPEDTLLNQSAPGVLLGAYDPENSTFVLTLLDTTTHGNLTLNASSGAFTYRPALNFNGWDGFVLNATDAGGAASQFVVRIFVGESLTTVVQQCRCF